MTKLASLKYKKFVWPHNPSDYHISFVKDVAEHKYVNVSGAEIEDFGIGARIFSGSGAFFGPLAHQTFSELATVFYERGAGKLIHPIWQPTMAVFTKLDVTEEPTPNYVAYSFEFIESRDIDVIKELTKTGSSSSGSGSGGKAKSVTHIVKSGESLSYIGTLYGIPWRQIATDNSKLIKNPNVLQIGWKLTINNPKKIPSKTSTIKRTNTTVSDKPPFSQLDYQRLYHKGDISGTSNN